MCGSVERVGDLFQVSPLPSSSLQSLCQVLDASVSMGSRVLETQLDSLLLALHQQVHVYTKFNCHNPDYTSSNSSDVCCLDLSHFKILLVALYPPDAGFFFFFFFFSSVK